MSNFVEFRDSRNLHVFRGYEHSAGHLAPFEWLTVCHVSGTESVNLSSSVGPIGDMWHLLIGEKSKVSGLMDKESYQPMKIRHVASEGTKGELSSPFFMDPTMEKGRADFFKNGGFLERKCNFSLDFSASDHRFASGQETKLFYVARATRGHRFCGVSTTPRCRGLLLLGYFRF